MTESALILLFAHLFGDFVVQSDRIARTKRSIAGLAEHGAHVAILTGLAIGPHAHGAPWAAIVVSHLAIDAFKAHLLDRRAAAAGASRRLHPFTAFATDQLLHLLVLAAVISTWPDAWLDGVFGMVSGASGLSPPWLQGLVLATAIIGLVPMGSIMITIALTDFSAQIRARATAPEPPVVIRNLPAEDAERPVAAELPTASTTPSDEGLPGAGKIIGWLERLLVFSLALGGSITAVGFVVTAKSVLRLGEINKGDRATAEYIIIGTMLSFAWALLIALLARNALAAMNIAVARPV